MPDGAAGSPARTKTLRCAAWDMKWGAWVKMAHGMAARLRMRNGGGLGVNGAHSPRHEAGPGECDIPLVTIKEI